MKLYRFGKQEAIEVLSKDNQFVRYDTHYGYYRIWDNGTGEDYGYITYDLFKKLNLIEVGYGKEIGANTPGIFYKLQH